MNGYVKITADNSGEYQAVNCKAEITIARGLGERAMLVHTLCESLHIDTRNRRTMRKLFRAVRKCDAVKPSGRISGDSPDSTEAPE